MKSLNIAKTAVQRWENRPHSRELNRLRTQQRNRNRVLQKMSVGQRALLVFIDWSFMPPPPQEQQLKFPKQEAMTKEDPELPCPLGCGMTCQGYTGTRYGNVHDQHTHIHNTCCRKDFYHISEINIHTSADLLSSFRFRGPGEMAYDAEVEGTPMLMTTISPDQRKLLLTLRRVDSSVKAKVLSVITSRPHMMFRFERVSRANCYSEATSLSFSVVEGGQPAVADTVKSLVALIFRKEQDKQDLGELINTYSEVCSDLPTEEECCKELAANGRYARKFTHHPSTHMRTMTRTSRMTRSASPANAFKTRWCADKTSRPPSSANFLPLWERT